MCSPDPGPAPGAKSLPVTSHVKLGDVWQRSEVAMFSG
jgi:hypothetical protein